MIFQKILCIIEKTNFGGCFYEIRKNLSANGSKVKDFVRVVQDCPYEIDLKSDKYVVDAKSILGIFSLDLSKPLTVEIHSDDCDDLIKELKQFA